ncbi:hypothetical protein NX059_006235 [Plenodomus lindquistii]|nr:hypothetical protein NX059_006235 [Plenodomus lindquistii]
MTHLRLFSQALPQSLRGSSQSFKVAKRPAWSLLDAPVPSRLLHQTACRPKSIIRASDMGFSNSAPNTTAGNDGPPRKVRRFMKVKYAPNQPDLGDRLAELVDSTWKISHEGIGLTRKYNFSNFDKAWEFMSKVAEECKVIDHHPDWNNNYGKLKVRWVTQRPPPGLSVKAGLSEKDVHMAEFCDKIADAIGQKPALGAPKDVLPASVPDERSRAP